VDLEGRPHVVLASAGIERLGQEEAYASLDPIV